MILRFAPPQSGGIWPGIAFLALLQISAVVLNLLPVPPFDGYGALAPFLGQPLRATIARYSVIITLLIFALLWYVPFINSLFWETIMALGSALRLPFNLVLAGYEQFRFWER
jgi:Zn-dependent protease